MCVFFKYDINHKIKDVNFSLVNLIKEKITKPN
jgi:hypothetical protein